MKHYHLLLMTCICFSLQSCITFSDVVSTINYKAARDVAIKRHIPMVEDSIGAWDIAGSVKIGTKQSTDSNRPTTQINLDFDHVIGKHFFLNEGISYYNNGSSKVGSRGSGYFYSQFERGGDLYISPGTVFYKGVFYFYSSVNVGFGIESLDIKGTKYEKLAGEENYGWVPNDKTYRTNRLTLGNTTHLGFNLSRIKLGVGVTYTYLRYNKNTLVSFDVEENKISGLLGYSNVVSKVGFNEGRAFSVFTPFFNAGIYPAKHIALTVQISHSYFIGFKDRPHYNDKPTFSLGIVYSIMSKSKFKKWKLIPGQK
jgi:hypothetical protein